MDNCFATCSCVDNESVTKADIDRYTDKIENVLNDEKGRRFFRNFLFTCKMRDGRRALDLWEHIEKLLAYKEDAESPSYPSYLKDVNKLIDEAERVEELDFATMERLIIAHDSQNKGDIYDVLLTLKTETTKALKKEYNAFRRRFVPSKSN